MRFITAICGLWLAGCLMSFRPDDGFREKFRALMQADKPAEAKKLVAQWEKEQPEDPDVYVAKFNLLLGEAQAVAVTTKQAGKGEFVINDPKTGKAVGSIGAGYDFAKVAQAMTVLRQGIALAPDRLDMRFGLAKATEFINDSKQQYKIVSEALAWRQSAAGKPWRWRDGAALPDPEEQFVPASVEGYISPYWQVESAEASANGLALAELLVKYYPQSSLGYFNKAIYYALTHDERGAYTAFAQADKLQPNDPETIANLVRLSLNLKEKAVAQRYLARLCKYADFKKDCQHYTDELKKL